MDQSRLSDYLALIKQHINTQEILLEYHSKVEAMVEIILSKDLINYPKDQLHNYLWVVSDLVIKAKELNEGLLGTLLNITSSIIKSEAPSFECWAE